MPRRKDIWRCAFVARIPARILAEGLEGASIRLFPEEPDFTFLADPFGISHEGRSYVLAEQYDYRTRHGVIEAMEFNGDEMIRRGVCLREPWHLSWPQIIRDEGKILLLPEAWRSGGLTLYEAEDFPWHWRPAANIELDSPPVDPVAFRRDGLWWLLYSPGHDRLSRISRLHVSFAEKLTGPWRAHPLNPVRICAASSRPGGAAIPADDRITLPVQDCTKTYGGALRALTITRLTPDAFEAESGPAILPPATLAPWVEGMHTLTPFGDGALIDVKRIDRSLRGLGLDARRLAGGYARG